MTFEKFRQMRKTFEEELRKWREREVQWTTEHMGAREEVHTTVSFQCVAVCCSVLQYVAVCCSVLQCVAVCCSVLQRVRTHSGKRADHGELFCLGFASSYPIYHSTHQFIYPFIFQFIDQFIDQFIHQFIY